MQLQVCGGKFKRLQINIPQNLSGFRPAKSIVREAICNIIQTRIQGSTVLDLCAGSCIFAMEMLSREAKRAIAVEQSSALCNHIKKQIDKYSWSKDLEILSGDAKNFITKCGDKFDIIYFDPPYHENELSALLTKLPDLCKDDGIVIFEFASGDKFIEENYSQYDFRKYGKSSVLFIKKEDLCR